VSRSALPRIALLALIWGSAFLWIKLADRGFSPVEVTLARLALGAAVLFAIVRVRREQVPRSGQLWVHIAVAALFANAMPYLLFAVAEQTVIRPRPGSSTRRRRCGPWCWPWRCGTRRACRAGRRPG
jgi:drug/metabolite transporter (DMT)-like permease